MNSDLDNDLPVLTEVLLTGQVEIRTSDEGMPMPMLGGHADMDWDILERDVREAVLKGLQTRLDLVLEPRIKEIVSSVFEQSLSRLSSEIKENLDSTIVDVVTRAVTQEVSRVRATRVR